VFSAAGRVVEDPECLLAGRKERREARMDQTDFFFLQYKEEKMSVDAKGKCPNEDVESG